jgi:20S proteasome alpha/beta subunit
MLTPKPRQPVHPKPKRLSQRKRMTLIAGLPCKDGIVLCADSLEVAGDYKVSVAKVRPVSCGPYSVIYGGAGNDASLIDGLEDRLHEALSKPFKGSLLAHIRKTVAAFYRSEVALHPGTSEEKRTEALLCVSETGMAPVLFHIAGPVVRQTNKSLLIGWDATLYRHYLERQYSSEMLLGHGVALALQLFEIAKDTCTWIGGDTRLIVLTPDSVYQELAVDISAIEARQAEVNRMVERMVLACSDTTLHPRLLQQMIGELGHQLVDLHTEHIRLEGRKTVRSLPDAYAGYRKLPWGTMLALGDDEMAGAYALIIPDLPSEYGKPLGFTASPDTPGAQYRLLPLDEEWKTHGATSKVAKYFKTDSSAEPPTEPPPQKHPPLLFPPIRPKEPVVPQSTTHDPKDEPPSQE